MRVWAATNEHISYNPSGQYLRGALVIIEHECPSKRNTRRSLRGVVRVVLFTDTDTAETSSTHHTALAFSLAFVVLRELDELDFDTLADESLLPQFGKRMEKPVVCFLERRHLRDATVAHLSQARPAAKLP